MKQDKNERRIISEEIATISPYDVGGGSIESRTKQLQERFLPTDILSWDGEDYRIIRNRPENDKEYAARIKKEERARDRARDKKKMAREQQTARERAEYERLKKKFGRG